MFEQIKNLLVEELDVDESKILPESEFQQDLGLNSLELADLVVLCEEKFGVEILEEDIRSLLTVKDICDYLEEKKNG